MDTAGRHKQEVSRFRVQPTLAVEQPHGAGQDEERLGDALVEMRARSRRNRAHFPSIEAEVSTRRLARREIARRAEGAQVELRLRFRGTIQRADLSRVSM